MFNVKCSWDGLPEGRNCSCVWSFWCSELCSVDQAVTVQRESVLGVRGQSDFAQFQWYVKDLCEDGGQLVSTGFQAGCCHTVWAWCLPSLVLFEDLAYVIFSYLQCRCGERGVAGGVNGCVERCPEQVWGDLYIYIHTHKFFFFFM